MNQRKHAEQLLRLIDEDHKRRHHMAVDLKKLQRDRTKFILGPLGATTLTVKRSTAL
jgi:hypothetical protein